MDDRDRFDFGDCNRIMEIVGRIVRESIQLNEPHDPKFGAGYGNAEVDYHDLKVLGEAYREIIERRGGDE